MQVDNATAQQLRQFIERVERLEEEKMALTADIREVLAEAKNQGFDTKIIRQILKIRKMDSDERDEQEHLLDVYMNALERTNRPMQNVDEDAA